MIRGCPEHTQNRSQNRCQKLLDFGPSWAPILGAFWPPGGCNMASRAPKMAPRRPKERPRRALYASRTAPAPPKTPSRPPKMPPRLSKSLQELSKSSPREVFEAPSHLQELCGGGFQAPSCCLAASSLWPASGLGGKREA